MKKILISFIVVVLAVVFVATMYNDVFAANANFNISDHDAAKDTEFSKAAVTLTGVILSVIRYTGAGIALISLIMIAMKYLYSSPGEKADYKKNLVVYVVGGVGMFSVGTIIEWIQKLSERVGAAAATE